MTAIPNTISLASIADGSLEVASDPRNNFSAAQTAINQLIAALSGGSAGQILQALSSTSVDWNGGTYQTYVPTWVASGVAPAIGNAVVVARFARIGKMVHAYGSITFGTTSTYGTGFYTFALPVNASASAIGISTSGSGFARDASANNEGQPSPYVGTATGMLFQYGATYFGTHADLGAAAPWAWATGDILSWNITYEAA